MARALELARMPSFTSPNPRVGAVVVRDGEVIGEGFHEGAGTLHAEAAALAGIDARGATLYVNLEPCSHHANTPPCAPALVEAGIVRVVAAIEDPDERVAGSGFAHLRNNGVEVTIGVLADEARAMNAAFLHQRSTGRPLVTLKLAMTIDGRLAAADGTSKWITGEEARAFVHRRRAEADAVMVGSGTVIADDPSLTARDVASTRQPARVIVDSSGSVRSGAKVFGPGADVIVATSNAAPHDVHTEWKEAGAEVLVLPGEGRVDLDALVTELGRRGWLEIYCEGGARLGSALLRDGLVDRLELHHGAALTGAGPQLQDLGVGTMSEALRFSLVDVVRAGDDLIATYMRKGN
jgi:diaminohydroxyphosphoribosylaminopyrimidine deaminase / 5-amino-6-(5-phosphoribosylamino)uracil reductase